MAKKQKSSLPKSLKPEKRFTLKWGEADPDKFAEINKTVLLAMLEDWTEAKTFLLGSDCGGVEGTHYMVPAAGFAERMPTIAYTVRKVAPTSTHFYRCRLPFDPDFEFWHGFDTLYPKTFGMGLQDVSHPFESVQKSTGLISPAEFEALPHHKIISDKWACEITRGGRFGLDAYYFLAEDFLAAKSNDQPFYRRHEPWDTHIMWEPFYLLAFLFYPSWEIEGKKWNSRVDDLISYGVAPPGLADARGDQLRYILKRAGIHRPAPRKA